MDYEVKTYCINDCDSLEATDCDLLSVNLDRYLDVLKIVERVGE